MAAGNTYTPIFTTTLVSAQNTFSFTSIPSTYTDLVLECNFATTASNPSISLGVNGDSGTNYSYTLLWGSGTAATSANAANRSSTNNAFAFYNAGAATGYSNIIVSNFQNYSNTTTYKTILTRYGSASQEIGATVSMWRNTAAINTITLTCQSTYTFTAGSTFSLYGILAA
jgi:hypothetical protein